jgi:hypothetical protein
MDFAMMQQFPAEGVSARRSRPRHRRIDECKDADGSAQTGRKGADPAEVSDLANSAKFGVASWFVSTFKVSSIVDQTLLHANAIANAIAIAIATATATVIALDEHGAVAERNPFTVEIPRAVAGFREGGSR